MTEKRRCRAGLRSPMIIREITVGPIGTCCYLILNEEQNACVLIDPGAEPERIRKAVGSSRLSAILLTHGHFDHIGAVDALMDPETVLYLHSLDHPMLSDPSLNGSRLFLGSSVRIASSPVPVAEGETFSEAGFSFQVLHTPGHTPGSVCYRVNDCLFTGDTLFHNGWGRTDLPGGDEHQIHVSLRRLIPLMKTLSIYPGHHT